MHSFVRWFIGEPSPDRWVGVGCLVGLALVVAMIAGGAVHG